MPNVEAVFGRPFDVPSHETNAGYTTVMYSTRMRFVSCAGASGSACGGGGAPPSAASDGAGGGGAMLSACTTLGVHSMASRSDDSIAIAGFHVRERDACRVIRDISELLPSDRKAPEVRQHAGVMRELDQGRQPRALLRWRRVLEERWHFQ